MTRQELITEVQQTKGNFWSAYDRGRLAALDGEPIYANPYKVVAPNITLFDWEQGWLDVTRQLEDAANQKYAAQIMSD